MNKRPRNKGQVRVFGSAKGSRRMRSAGLNVTLGTAKWVSRSSVTGRIYIGPTVEGVDQEYVKVISGKVDDRKPSFAR